MISLSCSPFLSLPCSSSSPYKTIMIPNECSQLSLFPSSSPHIGDSLRHPRSQTGTACGGMGWFLLLWEYPWLRIFCGWILSEVITGALKIQIWQHFNANSGPRGPSFFPLSLAHCTTSDFINQEGSQKSWPSSCLAQGTWCDWDATGLPQPGSQGLLVPTPTPTSCLTPKTRPASPRPSLPALRGLKSQGSD